LKKALMIACCLLSAALAMGSCVEVELAKPPKSSSQVRIVVSLEGHPASRVTVDFCTNGGRSCRTAVTGDDGVAGAPLLTHGEYYSVVAMLDDGAAGSLLLQVSDIGKATTTFSIDVTGSFHATQNGLAATDGLPIRERLQAFQGLLRDASGAMIAGPSLRIMRKGSDDHAVVQSLKSDATGEFSARLEDGMYIAFFLFPGFRTQVVPFEIAAQAKKELLVNLPVHQC
jgi:hypothetical protein